MALPFCSAPCAGGPTCWIWEGTRWAGFHCSQSKAQCGPTPSSFHIQASVQSLFTAHPGVVLQGLHFLSHPVFITPCRMHTLELVLLGQLYSSTAPFPWLLYPPLELAQYSQRLSITSVSSQHHFSRGRVTSSARKSRQCIPSMGSGAQGARLSWTHFPLAFHLAATCSLYPSSLSALCPYYLSSFSPFHPSCLCDGPIITLLKGSFPLADDLSIVQLSQI